MQKREYKKNIILKRSKVISKLVKRVLVLLVCMSIVQISPIQAVSNNTNVTNTKVETGDIAIDSAHFLDVEFRDYIQNHMFKDSPKSTLTQQDRENAHGIYLSNQPIQSLQGIGYFPI